MAHAFDSLVLRVAVGHLRVANKSDAAVLIGVLTRAIVRLIRRPPLQPHALATFAGVLKAARDVQVAHHRSALVGVAEVHEWVALERARRLQLRTCLGARVALRTEVVFGVIQLRLLC